MHAYLEILLDEVPAHYFFANSRAFCEDSSRAVLPRLGQDADTTGILAIGRVRSYLSRPCGGFEDRPAEARKELLNGSGTAPTRPPRAELTLFELERQNIEQAPESRSSGF